MKNPLTPAGIEPATFRFVAQHLIHTATSVPSASEDGRNYRPKHVELIEITNKLLLLHLVGCFYYCIRDARSHKHQPYNMNLYNIDFKTVCDLLVPKTPGTDLSIHCFSKS